MIGAADALDEPARALRCADVDDQIDIAPVDAEIERGGGDDGAQGAGDHRCFDLAAPGCIERTVMQGDRQRIVVDLPEGLEHGFRLAARVDKDQRQVRALDRRVNLGHRVARAVAGPRQWQIGLEDGDVGRGTAGNFDVIGKPGNVAGGRLRDEVGAQFGRPGDRRRQAEADMVGGKR